MKRILALVVILMAVIGLSGVSVYAATVGSPETVGKAGGVSLSLEYDKVFNRDMKYKSGTVTDFSGTYPWLYPGEEIKDAEMDSNRYFIKTTVGVHNRADLYLKLGMADANLEDTWVDNNVSPPYAEKDKFNSDSGFAWGGGFKVKAFGEDEGLKVGVSGDFLHYKVDTKWTIDGVDISDPNYANGPYKSETTVNEWQLAVTTGYTLNKITPYGGLKYSDMSLKNETSFNNPGFGGPVRIEQKFKADKNVGIFAGTDIDIVPKKLSVNIEGRFLDETAATLALVYKF